MSVLLTGFLTGFTICFLTVFLAPVSRGLLARKRRLQEKTSNIFGSSAAEKELAKDETESIQSTINVPRFPFQENTGRAAGHGIWIGLLIATGLLGIFQGTFDQQASERVFGFGPSLLMLCVAAIPLLVTSLPSDFLRPRSERHLLGLVLSGAMLSLFGYHIFILSTLSGTTAVAPLSGFFLTIAWLVLLAAIIEVASLVPFGVSGVVLILCASIFVGGTSHSVAAGLLSGLVPGAVLARLVVYLWTRECYRWGKAEVFLLGLWTTAMLNVSFLKSVALVGIVIPAIALTTILIIVMIRTFERSLILRDIPR